MIRFVMAVLGLMVFQTGGVCASAATPDLAGAYQVRMKIGERLFEDRLDLEAAAGGVPIVGAVPVFGTFTVAGVFTSVLSGSMICGNEKCECRFSAFALEGGRSYRVNFEMTLDSHAFRRVRAGSSALFRGSASLENGEVFGEFQALQGRH